MEEVKGYLMAKIHLYFLRYIDEPRVVSKSISEIINKLKIITILNI